MHYDLLIAFAILLVTVAVLIIINQKKNKSHNQIIHLHQNHLETSQSNSIQSKDLLNAKAMSNIQPRTIKTTRLITESIDAVSIRASGDITSDSIATGAIIGDDAYTLTRMSGTIDTIE